MNKSTSPHLDHLLKVGMLHNMANNMQLHQMVRVEATEELFRYRAEGMELNRQREKGIIMAEEADVSADHETRVYSGRGVLFSVADDREHMDGATTIAVIAGAIEDALDNGYETSEEIARWLVTSSFNYEPDKRVRFNSLLRAGDSVGAQMTRKFYNTYNELAQVATDTDDPKEKALAQAEATGFAEAVSIAFSPFSCEDPSDPRQVDWAMVDHVTELFEAEQRQVRRIRKGELQ